MCRRERAVVQEDRPRADGEPASPRSRQELWRDKCDSSFQRYVVEEHCTARVEKFCEEACGAQYGYSPEQLQKCLDSPGRPEVIGKCAAAGLKRFNELVPTCRDLLFDPGGSSLKNPADAGNPLAVCH